MAESTIASTPVVREIDAARARVAKMLVFHIPDLISTFTTIAPGQIETFPAVETREVNDKSVIDGTLAAIVAAQPRPTTDAAEMRWKLVFTDSADARVLEVYSTRQSLQLGMVGSTYVEFANDTLTSWLYKHFA